jgi:ribosome-associated protein
MKRKTAKPKQLTPLTMVQTALEDLKAQDIVVIDVHEATEMFDFIVIASGTSGRQVRALALHVMEELKKQGVPPVGNEGLDGGEWALVDLGDIVVHIMQPDIRTFYDLERLWQLPDAPAKTETPVAQPRATRTAKPVEKPATKKPAAKKAASTKAAASKPASTRAPATKSSPTKPSKKTGPKAASPKITSSKTTKAKTTKAKTTKAKSPAPGSAKRPTSRAPRKV